MQNEINDAQKYLNSKLSELIWTLPNWNYNITCSYFKDDLLCIRSEWFYRKDIKNIVPILFVLENITTYENKKVINFKEINLSKIRYWY
ncbi:hypothetical protein GJ496_010804 [Pomphorhynchus laevis]|nr:hypothetical protein GJ496_010804 [Pomphorhynchus laevis]